MRMCRRLQGELPEPEAKRFIEIQYADELRHMEAYRAYWFAWSGLQLP